MKMGTKSLVKVIIVVVIAALLSYVVLFGAKVTDYKILSVKQAIKLGLDLQGGVSVLLEAKPKPGETVTKEKMSGAREIIANRVNQLGVTEPIVTTQGENRILVELPGVKDSQKALDIIGQTASLQFVGPDEKVIITGDNVKEARAIFGNNSEPMVKLSLDSEGAKKFEKATEEFLQKPITITLDEKVISAPIVENVIPGGEAWITHLQSIEKAAELATLIQAGALPIDLQQMQALSVGPTLGADSLNKSLKAGIIGVALVLLFMLISYRLPGLIANIALVVYIEIVLLVFASIGATLTLPGIAGFILSIGMAVDANVLIFERFKEELKNGKTLRAAADAGFHRALTTIMDSNITTIIAALVLMYFGKGSIKGFAVTLLIGILTSLFSAVTVTKFLLINLINSRIITNKKLFGA